MHLPSSQKSRDIHELTLKTLGQMIAKGKDDAALLLDEMRMVIFDYRREVLARYFVARHGAAVLYGPFAGMRYLDKQTGGMDLTELIGCCEEELHGVVTEIVQKGYPRVINIGSARGYYAVGLARLLPQAQIFAYETKPILQAPCGELAAETRLATDCRSPARAQWRSFARLPCRAASSGAIARGVNWICSIPTGSRPCGSATFWWKLMISCARIRPSC